LPDRVSKTNDNTLFDFYSPNNAVFYNYWNGNTFSNLYGLPSGAPFTGKFKIDNANGVILLEQNFQWEYIMLEYISSPLQGQTYFVPIQFREAIIAYLRWKDIISLPNGRRGGLGDKRDRRHEFYNERRLAIARYEPIRLEDGYAASQVQTRLTVKG